VGARWRHSLPPSCPHSGMLESLVSRIPELPDGTTISPLIPWSLTLLMAGVCDNFTITTPEGRPSWDAYCQKEFLPSQDILNILEGSLRRTFQRLHEQNQTDQKDSNTELLISNILTSWNESLAKISPSTLADEKKEVEELLLGSAILAITSAVTDVLAMAVGILTRWYRAAGVAFFLSAGMSCGIVIFTNRILERAMLGAADQDWGGALGAYVAFVSQIGFGLCLMTGCCYKDLQRAKELRRRRRMTLKNEAVENRTFELSSGMERTAESPYVARKSVTSDGPGSPGMPQKSSLESTRLLGLAAAPSRPEKNTSYDHDYHPEVPDAPGEGALRRRGTSGQPSTEPGISA
jgi:hypothetical protein